MTEIIIVITGIVTIRAMTGETPIEMKANTFVIKQETIVTRKIRKNME